MFADPEHQVIAELLGAYSLDAVDPDEAALVEEHLGCCPRCREEVDQLREVAAALGNMSEEPPAEVWDRIAEGIANGATVHRLPIVTSAPPPKPVADIADRRCRRAPTKLPRRVWATALAAAGAAAVIVVLAISLVSANGRVSQLQSAVGKAAVRAALASPGHRVVSLRSASGALEAKVVIERSGTGYVVASSMSVLPTTETYQLWASINGQPISLGLLGHRVSAGAAFSLRSSAKARALMVTVEPAGGVAVPSHNPLATAVLPAD